MATLIPSLSSCVSRMQAGERRTAEQLEAKLDDDYLLWYDVPVGPTNAHPDFVVMHPSRGLLVLEVKDWRPQTILRMDRLQCTILGAGGEPRALPNPLEQARQYAHQIVAALERDAALTQQAGAHRGKLCFPWTYGVVFSRLTRKQFLEAELDRVIEPHRCLCSDDLRESASAEDFQSLLWGMFPFGSRGTLSLPQIDRVRWIMFPEVRIAAQDALFDAQSELPDLMRVMDLQQEQLARSLGSGHRVIHGVAGSGKTMILGYRAELLAKAASKPVLVLCYNEPLAQRLAGMMEHKRIEQRVHVRHFHKWCREQLVAYGQGLPPDSTDRDAFFAEMVERVIRGVEKQMIPSGQYAAVLIDEGHDFRPEWLKLVVQMVDPETNSLLVLYDDAQSIYERARKRKFSFKSVGILAAGRRTTVLRINYRNTRQILETASLIAQDLIAAEDADDDGVPLLAPVGCGREGAAPLILRLPNLHGQAERIADLLSEAHRQGHAWADMAILHRSWRVAEACVDALTRRRLPFQWRQRDKRFSPAHDSIKVLTLHVSKGLEFPVIAVPGLDLMPTAGEDVREEARLLYVGITRATQKLILTASGDSEFTRRLPKSAWKEAVQ